MELCRKVAMNNFYKRAWAEIHLDRLKYNYEICKSFLGDNTEFMAVVKANAYGHGDDAVAPYLQSLGINWFAVSNINEAIHIRHCGITKEILILGYIPPSYVTELLDYNIIETITGYEHAKALSDAISDGRKLRTHIKIDTGMGRIGLRHETVSEYCDEIQKIMSLDNILVEGIFTHPPVADSDDEDDFLYTVTQYKLFLEIDKELKNRGVNLKHKHFANSAGATYHDCSQSTLARYGIMLYGLHPNYELKLPKPLKPVMELKTIVSHIKTIKAGDYVSYGRTYKAEKDTKIATLTIGYADGYSRLLSSKADVLINGKRAKVVGRVCMDQTMVDVTGIDVKVGDTATLFGNDGDETITADELADIYGTIGYEVICGISKRVPRIIIDNNEIKSILEW